MTLPSRSRLAWLLALVALAAAAFAAPAAHAGPLVSSATGCEESSFSKPFLPWLDPADYVLAPDGGLEDGGASWQLSGGASVVDGNERYYVRDGGDSKSLRLPNGSSATTAAMCVGIEYPTLRFFSRGGSLVSSLDVEVLFEDAYGNVHDLSIGTVTPSSGWQPTLPYPVVANLLALLPGERTAVAFRFTPAGGTWQVDDVYVDPWRR